MINPTTKNIYLISVTISIIVFSLFNSFYDVWSSHHNMKFEVSFNSPEIHEISNYDTNEIIEDTNLINYENKEHVKDVQPYNWIIEIPEINLIAEISEGTTKEVMDSFVGHFEETKTEYGNIGLAAHNRGYPVNYFQDLKKLKEGSEIIYKHGEFIMTYIVKELKIIENTNWEYLKNTEDNRITLITCVENEPKYRRCIQGVEKIESEEF